LLIALSEDTRRVMGVDIGKEVVILREYEAAHRFA